jgi:monothiol glutaredoxin
VSQPSTRNPEFAEKFFCAPPKKTPASITAGKQRRKPAGTSLWGIAAKHIAAPEKWKAKAGGFRGHLTQETDLPGGANYGKLLTRKNMSKPKIIAYLKPSCGWSNGVRAVLRKYDLPFEDRDIINNPLQRQEMIEKSGQMLSPCVEINGHMLPDISGEEVEAWMLANKIVTPNDRVPDAPINQPCAHEMPAAQALNFLRR